MGHIKTTPQEDQLGRPSGIELLEITYGGKESPFGGLDTSEPPAYIAPNCFTSADGFIIVDGKLCVASLQQLGIRGNPFGTATPNLLGFGTFYNSVFGQLNYAFAYSATPFVGPPSGVNYIFYIFSWTPENTLFNNLDTLPVTLYDATSIVQQASLTLDCIGTTTVAPTTGSGATGNITSVNAQGNITGITVTGGSGYGVGDVVEVMQGSNITGWVRVLTLTGTAIATVSIFNAGVNYTTGAITTSSVENQSVAGVKIIGPSGIQTVTVPSWVSGFNRKQVVASMVGPLTDVTLSASLDGYSLVITANSSGVAGDTITVQDISTNTISGYPPPFYFSALVPRNLEGGVATQSSIAPRSFLSPASFTSVGGTLYIANIGPMILKFSGPGLFTTSTMYNGVKVIRKFGGSLIGLGLTPQLGVAQANQDMIFAWTGASTLDEWAPVTTAGNITGAGFAQLADIGDFLSGLVVTNNTAYIIRAQGVSYATILGSGTVPFQFAHISLGDAGEGALIPSLVCQYDQTGAFVGSTDIFQISGTLTPIGTKIKMSFFNNLSTSNLVGKDSNACQVFLGGDVFPLIAFMIDGTVYAYNADNQTWMTLTYADLNSIALQYISTIASTSVRPIGGEFNQNQMAVAMQNLIGGVYSYAFYYYVEGLPNNNSISNPCFVTFPQEELLLGRDVTIDALYLSLWASVTEDVTINFLFNKVAFSQLILTPAMFNTLGGNPIEVQIFPTSGFGTGVFTAHSPQLTIQVDSLIDSGSASIRFSKIQLYGSFEPAQRPV
jgi:hypothetical protein